MVNQLNPNSVPPKRSKQFSEYVDAAFFQLLFAQKLLIRRSSIANAIPALRHGFHNVQRALDCLAESKHSPSDAGVANQSTECQLCDVTRLTEPQFKELDALYQQYRKEGSARLTKWKARQYVQTLSNAVSPLRDWQRFNTSAPLVKRIFSIRIVPVAVLLLLGMFGAGAIIAAEMPPRKTGLRAIYYHNTEFSHPVATRIDKEIDFNWGTNAPYKSMQPDNFSVRWEGVLIVKDDERRILSAGADDSIKVFIDDELVVDNPGPHGFQSKKSTHPIGPGEHRITVEFVEFGGAARVNLMWSTPNGYWSLVPEYRLRPALH
ncbi:MAG: hypothetical protein JXX29_05770 [Deltaproteobacteria bacterium]|nr:hypothetical protein [Deltaproteobacteria bacterium]MBN2671157.1 hypothetical protein [Deltaproteobacteria bacterium]